jgi:fibronectin-binding autotransporter adhesin
MSLAVGNRRASCSLSVLIDVIASLPDDQFSFKGPNYLQIFMKKSNFSTMTQSPMKTSLSQRLTHSLAFPAAFALLALMTSPAQAASATWSATPTNADWEAAAGQTNWGTVAGTYPGSTTTFNSDIGTFLTSNTTSIAINSSTGNSSSLYIGGITFGAASNTAFNAFTIGTTGGNGLALNTGGAISIAGDTSLTANITETINAPIVIGTGSSSQTYFFTNSDATSTDILVFGGTISGGTSGVTTLNLNGVNTGANAINGNISNGAGHLAVSQSGTASWTLGGTNTYTGGTTVSGGTLNLTGSLAGSSVTTSGTGVFSESATGVIAGTGTFFTQGSTGTSILAGANTYTGATTINAGNLSISADDNLGTDPGSATAGNLVISTGTLTSTASFTLNSNRGIALGVANGGTGTINVAAGTTLTYNGIVANGFSANGLVVTGAGTLVLGGMNTYSGSTTISGGSTLSTGALGTLEGSAVASTVGADGYQNSTIILNNGTLQDVSTSSMQMYTQHGVTVTTLGGALDASGTAPINFYSTTAFAVSGSGTHALTLTGSNTATNIFAGAIVDGTGANAGSTSLTKTGAGTWALLGTGTAIFNNFSGGTTISAGTLIAEGLNGAENMLGTGNVSVASGTGLEYVYGSTTNGALAIGGNLILNGGTGTVLGGSIGSTTTGDEITVNGSGATATGSGAVKVNIFGVSGVTPATGTYTLLTAANGSLSLTPTLGLVYNNSNFKVNSVASSATTVTASITSATALTSAYWVGGLAGATNVWAASNGSTASNWNATNSATITAQPLTPGSGTAVYISNENGSVVNNSAANSVLGANMTIGSLTVNDTVNAFNLNADGYSLTLTGGITISAGVPASTIGANVILPASSTWTNNSANLFTVSGTVTGSSATLTVNGSGNTTISGEFSNGHGILDKSGSGTLTLSGPNGNSNFDRGINITQGEVDLAKTGGQLAGLGGAVIGNSSSPGAANSVVLKLFGSNELTTTTLDTVPLTEAITIYSDGQFALNGYNDTVYRLISAGGDITSTAPGGILTVANGTGTEGAVTFNTDVANAASTIGAGATVSSAIQATMAAGAGLAVNGTLTDSAGLTMGASASAGATTLSGTGSVNGVVTMNGGTGTGTNVITSSGTLSTGGIVVNAINNNISAGTVTGNITFNGSSTTPAALNVAGTASGTVNVSTYATLSGTGTTGAVTLGGTNSAINLVKANSTTGTLTVGGLTTTGGGTMTFAIGTSAGAIDNINDTGTLSLGGSTSMVITNLNNAASQTLVDGGGTTYLLLATNGVSGSGTLSLATTSLDGQNLSLNKVGNDYYLVVASSVTSTSYTLTTGAAATVLHAGESTGLTTTLTNTGTGTADSIDYSGVGASVSGVGSVSPTTTISGNLANNNTAVSNTGENLTTTAGTAGTATISSVGTLTNHTVGGSPMGTPTGTSVTVYSGLMVWNGASGGTWNTNANWTDSVNGAVHVAPGLDGAYVDTDTATFGTTGSGGTVDLANVSPSLKSITFNDATSYNLTSSGSGSLLLNGTGTTVGSDANTALVSVMNGSHTISAPVVLNTNTDVDVATVSNVAQQITFSGQISGSGGFKTTDTGTTILSSPTGNIYTGGTVVNAGKLYVNSGTPGSSTVSGTGSGAVTVNSTGTLAGSGNIVSSGVTVNAGGSIASGPAQTSAPNVTGPGITFTNTNVALSGTGTGSLSANLTFDLGAGSDHLGTGTPGAYNFANPITDTTYMTLSGTSQLTFTQGSTESVSLVDLTSGTLSLRQSTPYLLVTAGSDADYFNLVINSGTAANPIYSLSQNDTTQGGWVVGVYTGGTVNGTDVTQIAINQYGPDGVTALTPNSPTGVYPDAVLYLNAGNLEAVPEPGTWALMIGGLALLVVIQRRRNC